MSAYKPLAEILQEVSLQLAGEYQQMPSACDIRCTINDWIDSAQKNGERCPANYSQARAIAKTRRLIRTRWELTGRLGRE